MKRNNKTSTEGDKNESFNIQYPSSISASNSQPCPQCGFPIGLVAGSKEAICTNCGYKDPCCE